MGTFELLAASEEPGSIGLPEQKGLGNDVLLHNARWFTKLRWIAVSAVILAGLAGAFAPALFRASGLIPPVRWPWILAAVLVAANCLFTILAGRLRDDSSQSAIKATIWLQIVIDLIVLTVLVHIIGSTTTFISFAFLFHIALACIFFPPRESLLVTLLASGLFSACVAVETFGIVHGGGMVAHAPSVPHSGRLLNLAFAGTALSEAVRKRDRLLRTANERLMKADQEKTRQVLRTTHELKAPFSGIESNIQILKLQYWSELPESVRGIVERIEHRAQTLRERIREILVLGELKSKSDAELVLAGVNMDSVMETVLENVGEQARSRNVALDIEKPLPDVLGEAGQIAILFSNLVANAIQYSQEGGTVTVLARETGGDGVRICVVDRGIGISDEALPHIFEEYYRTPEGARCNPMSTGLGLAIVKHIAQTLGLKLTVTSEAGSGTTFEVTLKNRDSGTKKEETSCQTSRSLMTTWD
jgi:two-component system phosphate regulon sensor histidine kinase PhoR